MPRDICSLPYYHLVRITRDETGKQVDWVGAFDSLITGAITGGFAYQAVLKGGKPQLEKVRDGYMVRLYTSRISFVPLGYFMWNRVADLGRFNFRPDRKIIPCLIPDQITLDVSLYDREFRGLQRTLVELLPVRLVDRVTVQINPRLE